MENHTINKLLFRVDIYFLNCSNCRRKCSSITSLNADCSKHVPQFIVCMKVKCKQNRYTCPNVLNCVLQYKVQFKEPNEVKSINE